MVALSTPAVPVSWGELLDKMTILAIKRERILHRAARANVEREYRLLREIAAPALENMETARLFGDLKRVNEQLWEIEDSIRKLDAEGRFGPEFVRLAQSVYRRNDERAALKRSINHALSSELVEEKSYPAFAGQRERAEPSLAVEPAF
jgi:hypothetical protein